MKKVIRVIVLLCLLGVLFYYLPTRPTNDQLDKLNQTIQEGAFANSTHAVLIDYSKPVIQKRLWLIDLKTQEILLNCHVSHAKNSGWLWPTEFSNNVGSEFSCTGKFKTMNSYQSNFGKGKYKVGLRIEGLDAGNSNTFKRNIVFHTFFPLWSKGCFMTTSKNNKFIVDKLKAGSLVLVLK